MNITMTKMKKNIKLILFIILALYVLLGSYFCYNLLMYGDRWFADPGNTRLIIDAKDPETIPGNIIDRNGTVLAEFKKDRDEKGNSFYVRDYHIDSKYAAHVIGGNKQYGFGAEVQYVKYLLGYDNNFTERIYRKAFMDKEKGNDVILTIDIELQKIIYDLMSNYNGSAVVMNPKTGEILAMVSKPSFIPGVEVDKPEKDTLFNKAVFGQYPPGSIMKVITAAAQLQNESLKNHKFVCDGTAEFSGFSVSCYKKQAHGEVDLEKALEHSCNGYFADVALKLGWKNMLEAGEKFGFNTDFIFSGTSEIIMSSSKLPLNRHTSNFDLAWTGVGQGKTLVSPLHMAMIASAIANDGKMMEPRLIHGVQKTNGSIYVPNPPKVYLSPIDFATANKIKDMMIRVVEKGTGQGAQVEGLIIGGKTGTAEINDKDDPHTWFIGFASGENPTIAVSVVLENAGSASQTVTPLAGEIIAEAKKLGY